jgi:hypothetical protein
MLRNNYGGNGRFGGNGGNGAPRVSYETNDFCRRFDDIVNKLGKSQPFEGSLEDCVSGYKTTRSYAEQVVKMFSGDKSISILNGNSDISKLYAFTDTVKIAVVNAFDKEKAKEMKKAADKKLYVGLLEKFCDKYTTVLNGMNARYDGAEKIYESLRQAQDAAEIRSKRSARFCEEFMDFREKALAKAEEKSAERAKLIESDPFDSKADELTGDVLALESKARSSTAYAKAYVSKAEANKLLKKGYEKDSRMAGKLVDSCRYVSDTLHRYVTQFKTLIEMHKSIGDGDDFESFAKLINNLARKTSELGKAYHDMLPDERELRNSVTPFDEMTSRTNSSLLEQEISSVDDIKARLRKLEETQ